MTIRGGGALGVWHGAVEAGYDDLEDWYNREHHAERVAIAGFLRARRYVNLRDGPRFMSRYDVTDVDVLASAPYLAALNSPSDWSRRMFPNYRDTVRGAFRVVERVGEAEGGSITSLRFAQISPEPGDKTEASLREAARRITGSIGILAAEVWRVDAAVTSPPTEERNLRTPGEPFPGFAMIVDTSRPADGLAALNAALPGDVLALATVTVMQLVFQKFAATSG
jgi:hypothetical protein